MRRVVDLTFPIHEGMTTFPVPWHPLVEVSQLGRHGMECRETRKLVLGTHTGTHVDAPRHFVPNGQTIDDVPIDVFVGPALVLDFSRVPEQTPITEAELAVKVGARAVERVVLRYDWDRHWGTRKYYRDHPYLTREAARWLVARNVKLVAMDTPMPDDPRDGAGTADDSPIHKILLGSGIILAEYLTNLSSLTQEEIELVVLPLKVREGDGAPARCIAIERS